MQRRKDNEDSVLAEYISQLCISGKLCTEEAPRRRAMQHAMRAHEARVASRKQAAAGHGGAEAATTALSLTHLRAVDPASGAPAAAYMHDKRTAGHAAPPGPVAVPGLSAPTEPITTGAVGWSPSQDSAAHRGPTPVPSRGCTSAPQSTQPSTQALPQLSQSPPLTLDSMLSKNHVSMDLQQQLEGLFKVKCMGGNGADAHSAAAAAAAAKCATDNPEAALASFGQDGWLGWPSRVETPQPKAAASATQQSWLRAVSSMHDLQALEQLQKSRSGSQGTGPTSRQTGVRQPTAMLTHQRDIYAHRGTRHHSPQKCVYKIICVLRVMRQWTPVLLEVHMVKGGFVDMALYGPVWHLRRTGF